MRLTSNFVFFIGRCHRAYWPQSLDEGWWHKHTDSWQSMRDFRPAAQISPNPPIKYYCHYISYLLNYIINWTTAPSEGWNRSNYDTDFDGVLPVLKWGVNWHLRFWSATHWNFFFTRWVPSSQSLWRWKLLVGQKVNEIREASGENDYIRKLFILSQWKPTFSKP